MNISGLTNKDNMDIETQKLFFDKLEWNIKNTNIENDTANVEIEVTNKDFKTIIGNYMQKALKAVFSGNDLSNSQMESYLKEELHYPEEKIFLSTGNISDGQNAKGSLPEKEKKHYISNLLIANYVQEFSKKLLLTNPSQFIHEVKQKRLQPKN